VVTLAKSLGSGVPVGACLVNDKIAAKIKTNDLGTTFGGGMLAMAAVLATLDAIEHDKMIENAKEIETYLREKLRSVANVVALRGKGCLLGIEFDKSCKQIHNKLLESNIITGTSSNPKVLRLLPPQTTAMTGEKLDLLREALPYIQKFKGKTFVVKFSGKVTEDRDNLASLAEELALLHQVGIRLCVVHGGGKQLTELAEKMGVAQTVINGRRVTDDETLELAKMIFAGKINTEILAALRNHGIEAVGLSGVDGNIVHAERRPPREVLDRKTGERKEIDFGHVGDVLQINVRLLDVLLEQGYLPVVSSLGADDDGQIFNINADTIAADVAVSLNAEKLVLLSDVSGIYLDPADPETKISRMSVAEAEAHITNGTASGGMIPKLQNIADVIKRGIGSVHVISGSTRNALLSEVFTDSGTGTMITR
jgi:acetylglutamate kinase